MGEAVVALRKHVGETQQKFATRLDMSISALQNYEQDRTPEPKQLVSFLVIAKALQRDDLASVFRKAFLDQLGLRNAGTLIQIIK